MPLTNPLRRRRLEPGELADLDHGVPVDTDGCHDDTDQGWDFTPPETLVHDQEA